MASETKAHPYHLVDPSPWPLLGTISALTLTIGGIIYMHSDIPWALLVGVALLLATFYFWWRDVIREANRGHHTSVVRHGLRVGMLLFITSEVMFFFAFFWAFFDASLPLISRTAAEVWPPEGVVPMDPWGLPFLNTLILLTSGATVTIAHHAVVHGDRPKLVFWTGATVLLGFLFLTLQAIEYAEASFGFTEGIYPSTFFMATGFHGFHVFIGACFLTVCFFRARRGDFTPEQHVGFEAAAWYWHFVDVVWLFLFTCVYWWGSAGYSGPMH